MRGFLPRLLIGALVVGQGTIAIAEESYFSNQPQQPLTYRVDGARSAREQLLVVSLAAATVASGAVGLLFHRASRDASDEVTQQSGDHSARIYTREIDARRRDALLYKNGATISYAVAGALLLGTITAFILTHPPDEIVPYRSRTDSRVSSLGIVPVRAGALVGASWRY